MWWGVILCLVHQLLLLLLFTVVVLTGISEFEKIMEAIQASQKMDMKLA